MNTYDYEAPEVTVLGRVTDLTQVKHGSVMDNAQASPGDHEPFKGGS